MIGYTLFGTNDFDKALAFYDALFAEIGVKRGMEFPNACTWGEWGAGPMFGVCKPHNGEAATTGNGTMIALVQSSRTNVDKLYAKAAALGGKDEGAPGVRGEEGDQAFYGAYFRDLDGNKICAFAIGPAA